MSALLCLLLLMLLSVDVLSRSPGLIFISTSPTTIQNIAIMTNKDTTSSKTSAPDLNPKPIVINETCSNNKFQILANSDRICNFKTCRDYCKFKKYCRIFSYNNQTGDCYLFLEIKNYPENLMDDPTGVGMGNMECLECVGGIDDVLQRNISGLYIHQSTFSGRCLAVRNEEVNMLNGYQLSWKPCSKANRWVLSYTPIDLDGDGKLNSNTVRVSLLGLDWSLQWQLSSNGEHAAAHLARTERYSADQTFVLKKEMRGKICRFNISIENSVVGTESESSQKIVFTDVQSRDKVNMNKSLEGISFSLPIANDNCPLEMFSVNNGEVINEENFPLFLSNNSVKIRCNPGFGTTSINFTDDQEVQCKKFGRQRNCTQIKESKKCVTGWNRYILLGLVITGVLITEIFGWVLFGSLCKMKYRRAEPGVAQET